METISGETDALTAEERGKQFDLSVSRANDMRDVNLRRDLQLNFPQAFLKFQSAPPLLSLPP